MTFTFEQAAGYLAAMIDGEGSVSWAWKGRTPQKLVQINNTEMDIIQATCEACDVLGISYTIRSYDRANKGKLCHTIFITQRDHLARLNEVVVLRSQRKREALAEMVEDYGKRGPARYWIHPRRPSAEQLRAWYVDEQRSANEIAEMIGEVKAVTVIRWLERAGIPQRPRGETQRLVWHRRRAQKAAA